MRGPQSLVGDPELPTMHMVAVEFLNNMFCLLKRAVKHSVGLDMLSFTCFVFLGLRVGFFLSLIFDWLCVSCIRSGAQDFIENKVEEKNIHKYIS